MRPTRLMLVFSIVTLGPMSQARAQTNEEAFEQFQWQVATPGSRTSAMGGASIASVEDASAAVMNPAGLVNAGRRFSVEFRSTDFRVGRLAAVDSLFTGAMTTSSKTMNALSFVGAVVPLGGGRVALALARHEFLHYDSSFHLAPRALPGLAGVARGLAPVESQTDFRAVSYAAAIGVAVHDSLRLGMTVSLDRLRADTLNTRHDIIVGRDPFDLSETAVIANQSRIDDADTGVGLAIGAVYQPVPTVSLGVVFSRRPSLEVSEDFQLNAGRQRGENGPLVSQTGFPTSTSLNVPDRLSAGVAVRPHRRMLVAFDAAHTTYSELAKGLTPVIGHDLVTASDFQINDGTELHLGGELNIGSDNNPVFLRAGVFTIPDHRLRFVGNVQPGANITAAQAQRINVIERSVFNLGKHETEVKGTFGGGFALGRHFQTDVAYVWKERFVVSLGVRP